MKSTRINELNLVQSLLIACVKFFKMYKREPIGFSELRKIYISQNVNIPDLETLSKQPLTPLLKRAPGYKNLSVKSKKDLSRLSHYLLVNTTKRMHEHLAKGGLDVFSEEYERFPQKQFLRFLRNSGNEGLVGEESILNTAGNKTDLTRLIFAIPLVLDNFEIVLFCSAPYLDTIAKKFQDSSYNFGSDREDKFQVQIEGLMVAFLYWNWRREGAFLTYATYWCKQRVIRNECDFYRTVRYPVSFDSDLRVMQKEMLKFRSEMSNANPTWDHFKLEQATKKAFSTKLDATKKAISSYTDDFESWDYNPGFCQHIISLDFEVNEDGETLIDLIEERNYNLSEYLYQRELSSTLNYLVECLTYQQSRVLRLKYLGSEQLTLTKVSEYMDLSRERVRQIEGKALQTFRRYGHIGGYIRPFVGNNLANKSLIFDLSDRFMSEPSEFLIKSIDKLMKQFPSELDVPISYHQLNQQLKSGDWVLKANWQKRVISNAIDCFEQLMAHVPTPNKESVKKNCEFLEECSNTLEFFDQINLEIESLENSEDVLNIFYSLFFKFVRFSPYIFGGLLEES
ncbi:MAG: sigma-70 family RNA polymerase sigma factor [Patescibacteria group bacterium]